SLSSLLRYCLYLVVFLASPIRRSSALLHHQRLAEALPAVAIKMLGQLFGSERRHAEGQGPAALLELAGGALDPLGHVAVVGRVERIYRVEALCRVATRQADGPQAVILHRSGRPGTESRSLQPADRRQKVLALRVAALHWTFLAALRPVVAVDGNVFLGKVAGPD